MIAETTTVAPWAIFRASRSVSTTGIPSGMRIWAPASPRTTAIRMGDVKYSFASFFRSSVPRKVPPKYMATAGQKIKIGRPTPSSLMTMPSASAQVLFSKANWMMG